MNQLKKIYIDMMNKILKEEVLFSKELHCYPFETEFAKLYHNFLIEHPQYENDDIKCKIEEVEEQEDHYGNGGGVRRTLIIYRYVIESDADFNKRIEVLEDNLILVYKNKFNALLKELNNDLKEFPSKERVFYEIDKAISFYRENNFNNI